MTMTTVRIEGIRLQSSATEQSSALPFIEVLAKWHQDTPYVHTDPDNLPSFAE